MARIRKTKAGIQRTLHAAGFSGDGRNMRSMSRGGIRGKVWWAWVFTHLEQVNCALVDLPAGKYGTLTPVSRSHLLRVAPGLAS